jgi:hypothetical protein
MYEQYPKSFVDSRLARRRLAQMFESAVDRETKRRFTPVSDRTLATAHQKNAGKSQTFLRDLVRSITSCVHRIRIRTLVKHLGTGKCDVSGLCLMLVLVLLPEIAAAKTDNRSMCTFRLVRAGEWEVTNYHPINMHCVSSRHCQIRHFGCKNDPKSVAQKVGAGETTGIGRKPRL